MKITKKKSIFLSVIFLYIMVVGGTIYFTQKELKISTIAQQKLKHEKVASSKIKKLCDLSQFAYKEPEVTITEEELQQCVKDELEQYEQLIELKDKKIVEENDYITISYTSTCEGQIIDRKDRRKLKVGAGNFDIDLEKELVGAEKGKKITVTKTISKDVDMEQLAGKEETVEMVVTKISKLEQVELTDEWVQENYELENVEAFYEMLKEEYITQEQAVAQANAKEKLLQEVLKACEFDINDDEVLEYALSRYNEQENNATGYGTDMETYIQDFYGMSIDDYYEKCYKEAENEIKRMLFVGAFSDKYSLNVREKDVQELIEIMGTSMDKVAKKDYVLYEYEVLEEEVLEQLIKKTGSL